MIPPAVIRHTGGVLTDDFTCNRRWWSFFCLGISHHCHGGEIWNFFRTTATQWGMDCFGAKSVCLGGRIRPSNHVDSGLTQTWLTWDCGLVWEEQWINIALYTPLIDGDCLPMCNTDGYSNMYTRKALDRTAHVRKFNAILPRPGKRYSYLPKFDRV